MVTITIGRPTNPAKAAIAAGDAAKARAEHHRQVDDVGTGQEMAQREGLVELVRSHPAVLVDDGAPREYQHAAETRQRHPGERDKQHGQAGRWRAGGFPARTARAAGGESDGIANT